MMRDGRKILARELVEQAFQNIKKIQIEKYHKAKPENRSTIELNPKEVFHKAVENCKPVLALTPIKRGGVKYQVCVNKICKETGWNYCFYVLYMRNEAIIVIATVKNQ